MAERKRKPTAAERRERAAREALRFPDVPAPEPIDAGRMRELLAAGGGKARAWTYNVGSRTISLGAFDAHNHNSDGDLGRGLAFRAKGQGGPWFERREDAARALRWHATVEAARSLLALDGRIESYLAMALPAGAPDA